MSRVRLLAQVNNLFDRRYYTAAQLGPAGFTDGDDFVARPLPAVDGEFPLRHTTFYAPGAPIRAFAGARVSFCRMGLAQRMLATDSTDSTDYSEHVVERRRPAAQRPATRET